MLPLLQGDEAAERTVFAEMHVEDVPVPCFMVRRGRYKYVHVHGVDAQLFDLEVDPREWHNLAGTPEHAATEGALRAALLERFDVDAIEQDIRRTIATRLLIEETMQKNGTLWDYRPDFDPSKDALTQYLPAAQPATHRHRSSH